MRNNCFCCYFFLNLKVTSPTVTVLYLPNIPQSTGHETTQPKDQPAEQASFPHLIWRHSALLFTFLHVHVFCLNWVDVVALYIQQQTFTLWVCFYQMIRKGSGLKTCNTSIGCILFHVRVTLKAACHTF